MWLNYNSKNECNFWFKLWQVGNTNDSISCVPQLQLLTMLTLTGHLEVSPPPWLYNAFWASQSNSNENALYLSAKTVYVYVIMTDVDI